MSVEATEFTTVKCKSAVAVNIRNDDQAVLFGMKISACRERRLLPSFESEHWSFESTILSFEYLQRTDFLLIDSTQHALGLNRYEFVTSCDENSHSQPV